jgi:hypothetical protein
LLRDVLGHDVADEIRRRRRGFFVFQIHKFGQKLTNKITIANEAKLSCEELQSVSVKNAYRPITKIRPTFVTYFVN